MRGNWNSTRVLGLLFLVYSGHLQSQPFLATNLVSTSGNVTELECVSFSWTLGEVFLSTNNNIISGQQGYITKKITPTLLSDNNSLCGGIELKLTARDTLYFDSVQWFLDGIRIQGAKSGTYKPSISGAYSYLLWNAGAECRYSSNTLVVNNNSSTTPTVTSSGSPVSLLTSSDAASYQWYVNDRLIVGQINQNYTVRYNGKYHVLVTYPNGCIATSSYFTVNESDFLDITRSGAIITDQTIIFDDQIRKLILLPNALKEGEMLNVQFSTPSEWAKVALFTSEGQLLSENEMKSFGNIKQLEIKTEGMRAGTYFLKAHDNKGFQLEKLIIYR